jgi:hypothetical protein
MQGGHFTWSEERCKQDPDMIFFIVIMAVKNNM